MCDTGHMAVHPHPHPHPHQQPLSNGTQRQSRASLSPLTATLVSLPHSTDSAKCRTSVAPTPPPPPPETDYLLDVLIESALNWKPQKLLSVWLSVCPSVCPSVSLSVWLCCCLLAWKLCRHVHAPGHKKARLIIKSRPLLRPPTQMNINGRKLCRAPSLGFSVRAC